MFITEDFNVNMLQATIYELPDGQILAINKKRFMCPEGLLQSTLMRLELEKIHEILRKTVRRCSLHSNIVTSGATSLFPGFSERIRKEICGKMCDLKEVDIVVLPKGQISAWIGGSFLVH
jgi:actin-related protein